MLEIFRNLARRKLRSALTVTGIVIGIFALTTMGAMAEHFNALLSGGVQYLERGVPIAAPDGQQAALLPISKLHQLEAVQGVVAAYPSYSIMATPGGGINFGPPDTIVNETPDQPLPAISGGRDLAPGSRGEVVLGAGMSTEFKKKAGDTIDLPVRPSGAKPDFVNHRFRVVGVLKFTGGIPDTNALVSDADARMLLRDSLSPPVRNAVDVNTIAQGFNVYPKAGTAVSELDRIADRINRQVPGVQATRPSQLIKTIQSTDTTFTAVFTGTALLALIVGGLSVINTMVMAVSERVREIGLKKALGAHTGHVLREYVFEAAVIGLIGGLAGYLVGVALTSLVRVMGFDVFLITPRLTVLAIGFAVVLGALAGLIPAFRAARLDPVAGLRSSN